MRFSVERSLTPVNPRPFGTDPPRRGPPDESVTRLHKPVDAVIHSPSLKQNVEFQRVKKSHVVGVFLHVCTVRFPGEWWGTNRFYVPRVIRRVCG